MREFINEFLLTVERNQFLLPSGWNACQVLEACVGVADEFPKLCLVVFVQIREHVFEEPIVSCYNSIRFRCHFRGDEQ